MSLPLKLDQEFELRDSTGKIVAYLAPASIMQHLKNEIERLREELENVKAQRDRYQAGMIGLMKEFVTFTPEEIADMDKNGLSFEQLMEQLEPILKGAGHSA
jgi:hypothetical protein